MPASGAHEAQRVDSQGLCSGVRCICGGVELIYMTNLKDTSLGRRKTLRNRWTASFGVLVVIPFFLFWLAWTMEEAHAPGEVERWTVWFLAIFFPVTWWFLLKASFFTNIQIGEGVVVIRNLFSKTVIPAEQVSSVTWEGGVDVITRSGEKYWCFNLGGSLIGALAGYPTNRRCAREIEDYLESFESSKPAQSEDRVTTSLHLNILFLACSVLGARSALFLLELAFA
ncbi:hypothetical protein [Nocardiopsis sp. Huas11]|uniref:hypothetical protein n=1 Tax=Nocardiopsis sp. Huas11 TaxID=2183912 RepID=UPI0011C3D385|nr:hypothetical protein [Nocardiopsis sp. Huas11]